MLSYECFFSNIRYSGTIDNFVLCCDNFVQCFNNEIDNANVHCTVPVQYVEHGVRTLREINKLVLRDPGKSDTGKSEINKLVLRDPDEGLQYLTSP